MTAPFFPPGLGAGGGSSPPGAASAPPSPSGVAGVAAASAASAVGILLVFKLALDDLGLGATAGALNPHDVILIGGQDGLQLLCEGVRLHFGVYSHHSALVLI